MAWIIGRKLDKEIVDVTSKAYDQDHTLEGLQYAIPLNKGGVAGDYSYFRMSQNESNNYFDGKSYNIIWTGDSIAGINFTPENNKPWIKLSTNKTNIVNDGVEYATITLEFWKADLSGILNNVNMLARRVPVLTPKGIRFVRLNIVNGVATARFRSTISGEYVFPSEPKRYGTSRIFNQVIIEVDDISFLELI